MGLNKGVYFSPYELTLFVQFNPQNRGIPHLPTEAHPALGAKVSKTVSNQSLFIDLHRSRDMGAMDEDQVGVLKA